jgi:hypothetical protein
MVGDLFELYSGARTYKPYILVLFIFLANTVESQVM